MAQVLDCDKPAWKNAGCQTGLPCAAGELYSHRFAHLVASTSTPVKEQKQKL